ncbi:MAG: response regulator [Methanobacteriota archaeon]|nr:MAG: response regulator [Euryarchaeota archaeon]
MAKILFADDEPDIVYLVKKLLERNGHETIVTYSGNDVLTLAKKERPDLVLLDIMMPGPNGWEVSKALKSDEETRDIPVVMLTVRTSKDSIEKSLTYAKATAHIGKPATTEEILHTIDAVLSPSKGAAA